MDKGKADKGRGVSLQLQNVHGAAICCVTVSRRGPFTRQEIRPRCYVSRPSPWRLLTRQPTMTPFSITLARALAAQAKFLHDP